MCAVPYADAVAPVGNLVLVDAMALVSAVAPADGMAPMGVLTPILTHCVLWVLWPLSACEPCALWFPCR